MGLNSFVALNVNNTWVHEEAAVSNSRVRIVSLSRNLSTLGVDEAVWLPSTIATAGFVITVETLLLGKLDKFTCGNEVGTFHRGDSRKGPARTAVTLVLNWVYSSFCYPVDWGGKVRSIKFGGVTDTCWSSETHNSLNLKLSSVRELVVSQLMCDTILGIPVINNFVLGHIKLLSEQVLLLSDIGFAVCFEVWNEFFVFIDGVQM